MCHVLSPELLRFSQSKLLVKKPMSNLMLCVRPAIQAPAVPPKWPTAVVHVQWMDFALCQLAPPFLTTNRTFYKNHGVERSVSCAFSNFLAKKIHQTKVYSTQEEKPGNAFVTLPGEHDQRRQYIFLSPSRCKPDDCSGRSGCDCQLPYRQMTSDKYPLL